MTEAELRSAIVATVPEAERASLLSNEGKLRNLIAQLFASKLLAADAANRSLNAEEQAQLDYARERALAQLQINHVVGQGLKADYSADAQEFYLANPEMFNRPEQVRVEHILVSTQKRSKAEAEQRVRELQALLAQGERSFPELAQEYSDDDSVRDNGGDLGFFARGKMVPAFEQAAFALKAEGEVTGPVETQFGLHFIKLLAHRPAERIPFEQVRQRLSDEQAAQARKNLIMREYERIGALPGTVVDQEAIQRMVEAQRAASASGAQK
ncbi:MAG: peptidylprolyl isomerase [Thauera sp.]|nr:peptidylprolyl isomerase [Thauera sp.]